MAQASKRVPEPHDCTQAQRMPWNRGYEQQTYTFPAAPPPYTVLEITAQHQAVDSQPPGHPPSSTQWPQTTTHPAPNAPNLQPRSNLGEDNDVAEFNNFSDKSERKAFLRKVYGILMCQMLVTTGFVVLFLYQPNVKLFAMTNTLPLPIFAVWMFICMVTLAFQDSVRRKFPGNLIVLIIFTLSEGSLLGYISGFTNTRAILIVTSTTAMMCFLMTLFGESGCCFICLNILVVPAMSYGIFWLLVIQQDQNRITELVFATIVAFAYCCFLAYDMDKIIHKNKHGVLPHEYIYAVLSILWDTSIAVFVVIFYLIVNALLSIICLRIQPKCSDSESEVAEVA